MQMTPPTGNNDFKDEPIRCYYCNSPYLQGMIELTVGNALISPDGYPSCGNCYNKTFKKEFTWGVDPKELR